MAVLEQMFYLHLHLRFIFLIANAIICPFIETNLKDVVIASFIIQFSVLQTNLIARLRLAEYSKNCWNGLFTFLLLTSPCSTFVANFMQKDSKWNFIVNNHRLEH
jgi:hypothetical protein